MGGSRGIPTPRGIRLDSNRKHWESLEINTRGKTQKNSDKKTEEEAEAEPARDGGTEGRRRDRETERGTGEQGGVRGLASPRQGDRPGWEEVMDGAPINF